MLETRLTLAEAVANATGATVVGMTVVHGGDTAAAFRVELASGDVLFAKTHASPPPASSARRRGDWNGCDRAGRSVCPGSSRCPTAIEEAAMGRAGIPRARMDRHREERRRRRGGLRAGAGSPPRFGCSVLRSGRSTDHGESGPAERTERDVGGFRRRLSFRAAGADRPRAIGASRPTRSIAWNDWQATLERFDDGSPPARLHGDLWAGNRIVDRDGASWLIDPAAHGGHREFDLAMMRLFGGFGAEAFDELRRRASAGGRLARSGGAPPDRTTRRACDQVRRRLRRRSRTRHRPVRLIRRPGTVTRRRASARARTRSPRGIR